MSPEQTTQATPENDIVKNILPPVQKKNAFLSIVREIVQFVVIGAVLYFGIRLYIAQPFIVSGSSMVPTFTNGDYLIVDELSFHVRAPERGEVIVFKYPNDTSKYFIKRIIGLPDETVTVAANKVTVKNALGATTLEEPYLNGPTEGRINRTLGPSEYFVMGDNRQFSSDSRSWGPINREHIVGRALVRLFPIAHADVLPGDYKNLLSDEINKKQL